MTRFHLALSELHEMPPRSLPKVKICSSTNLDPNIRPKIKILHYLGLKYKAQNPISLGPK